MNVNDNERRHAKAEGEDYPAIRAWGNKLGSYKYYIDNEVLRARASKAPQDAIYRRENGTWARLKDIKDLDSRHDMYALLKIQDQLS